MPIFVPGKRGRDGRQKGSGKRTAVAVLQLTAMVDMFTVLAVFLLQNYATTGEVLYISEEVSLPDAAAVKELKPSNVVVVSSESVSFNSEKLVDFDSVKEQEDWMVEPLRQRLTQFIEEQEKEKKTLGKRIKKAVKEARKDEPPEEEEIDEFRRITIQADRKIDFLSVKKVMYTVTEAGIYEINFAVIKREDKEAANL